MLFGGEKILFFMCPKSYYYVTLKWKKCPNIFTHIFSYYGFVDCPIIEFRKLCVHLAIYNQESDSATTRTLCRIFLSDNTFSHVLRAWKKKTFFSFWIKLRNVLKGWLKYFCVKTLHLQTVTAILLLIPGPKQTLYALM